MIMRAVWRSILILIVVLTLPALVAYFFLGSGVRKTPAENAAPKQETVEPAKAGDVRKKETARRPPQPTAN